MTETHRLHLEILLPSRIFLQRNDIVSLTVQTQIGRLGFLPHRLDCTAAVVPGILEFLSETGERSVLAVDEGLLVKVGCEIRLAVRHAHASPDGTRLGKSLAKQIQAMRDQEKDLRSTLSHLEGGFMQHLAKLAGHG